MQIKSEVLRKRAKKTGRSGNRTHGLGLDPTPESRILNPVSWIPNPGQLSTAAWQISLETGFLALRYMGPPQQINLPSTWFGTTPTFPKELIYVCASMRKAEIPFLIVRVYILKAMHKHLKKIWSLLISILYA